MAAAAMDLEVEDTATVLFSQKACVGFHKEVNKIKPEKRMNRKENTEEEKDENVTLSGEVAEQLFDDGVVERRCLKRRCGGAAMIFGRWG
ncbi:hypothetical protein QL285_005574 [Trifolium repens]|jgi:hypothetical protein|nr:hypothetical protein QL285_005574 [Trifolium repens]